MIYQGKEMIVEVTKGDRTVGDGFIGTVLNIGTSGGVTIFTIVRHDTKLIKIIKRWKSIRVLKNCKEN